MINIAALANILKKVIAPTIQEQLPNETILLQHLRRNAGVTVMPNNEFHITMRTGRHSGIYQVGENVAIRTGKAVWAQAKAPVKYAFGSFEITDQAIEAAKDDAGAIANILTENSRLLKDDLVKDINRVFFGDGSGQLCLADGAGSNSTTLIVKKPGTEYLVAGMWIIIGTAAPVEIVSVDSDTQVTLAAPRTWPDNAVVKKEGADEMMGLKGIIDDGTYVATIQNIPRATNPWAKAYCHDAAGALTEAQMVDAYIAAQKYAKTHVIFCGPALFKKYGSLLTSMKKTADLKEILSGGWRGLEFMGGECGVRLDYDCPEGFMFFVSFDSLTIGELTEVSWLDRGAGILTKVPGYAKWEGTLRYYANLICKHFRANARLANKT